MDKEKAFSILERHMTYPSLPSLLGVDTREMSHNRMIHNILQDHGVGSRFVEALLRHSAKGPHWDRVGERMESLSSPRFQASLSPHHVVDEEFVIKTSQGDVPVLLELKVEDPRGLHQLAEYLSIASATSPEVLGMLVRLSIGLEDESNDRVAVVGVEGYCKALGEIAELGSSKRVCPERIAEYRRSCESLWARDYLLTTSPQDLWSRTGGIWDAWWDQNWRWCCERLARDTWALLRRDSTDGNPPSRPWGGVGKDPNGSFVDCYCGGGEHPDTSVMDGALALPADRELAYGFAKLRVMRDPEVRLEIHTITSSYDASSPRAEEELAARLRLAKHIEVSALEDWQRPTRVRRESLSGCIRLRKIKVQSPSSLARTVKEELSTLFESLRP